MFVLALGWFILAIAIIIAVVVTLQNVRGAKGPAERRFVLWNCIGIWSLTAGALILGVILTGLWRYIVVGVYAVLLVPFVYWASMRRQLIRQAENLKLHSRSS